MFFACKSPDIDFLQRNAACGDHGLIEASPAADVKSHPAQHGEYLLYIAADRGSRFDIRIRPVQFGYLPDESLRQAGFLRQEMRQAPLDAPAVRPFPLIKAYLQFRPCIYLS